MATVVPLMNASRGNEQPYISYITNKNSCKLCPWPMLFLDIKHNVVMSCHVLDMKHTHTSLYQ